MSIKSEKSSKVLILDGSNYTLWKAGMQICLKSKDENIWQMLVKGYTTPTITDTDGKVVPKLEETWNKNDLNNSKWNNQGLNAIQCNVTKEEFRKILNCTTSKQAQDILNVFHEGINIVKC